MVTALSNKIKLSLITCSGQFALHGFSSLSLELGKYYLIPFACTFISPINLTLLHIAHWIKKNLLHHLTWVITLQKNILDKSQCLKMDYDTSVPLHDIQIASWNCIRFLFIQVLRQTNMHRTHSTWLSLK